MSLRHIFSVFTVGVVLLTGCSSEADEPAALPTKTPIPTVGAFTESPDPEAEAEPEPDTVTPKQLIRRWASLSNQMQNTGKSDEFRMASQDCPACLGLADHVDAIYEAGGYVETEGWRVLRIVLPPDRGRRIDAIVSVRSGATSYRESADDEVKKLTGARQDFRFVLRKRTDSWSILEYHLLGG